jgi:hypothetical protein
MPTTTTTQTWTYLAMKDDATKHWHLGALERGAKCFCGCLLVTPEDTRAVARRLKPENRNYQTDRDISRVTCRACQRGAEWARANGREPVATTRETLAQHEAAAAAAALADVPQLREARERHNGNGLDPHEAAALAAGAVDPAEQTDGAQPRRRRAKRQAAAAAAPESAATATVSATPRKRGKSRADRANEQQDRDRARRAELAASADATVAAIDAAVGDEPATVTPARPRRVSKARALVDAGLAANLADARAQLADMGE